MSRSSSPLGAPACTGRLAIGCSALLIGVGALVPDTPWWGLHLARFLPDWFRFTILVLLAAAFFVRPPAIEVTDSVAPRRRRVALTAFAAAAMGLLGMLAGPATQLLGDGQLIARDFQLALEMDQGVVARSVPVILSEDPIARGTTVLHYATTRAGHEALAMPALRSLVAGSVVLGMLFVASLVWIVSGLRLDSDLRWWILGLVVLSPATLLFLGYVENYGFLQWVLGLYTVAGLGTLAGRVRIAVPTSLLLVAVLLHVQALVFAPSLVLLWGARLRGPTRIALIRWLPLLASVGVLIVAIAAAELGADRYVLRPWADGRALLSIAHVVDWLNAVLLVFPLAPLALWLMAYRCAVLRPVPGDEGDGARAFAALLLGPALVYLFVVDPELGMARDWDRGAFLLWGWVAQIAVTLVHARRARLLDAETVRRWTAPALIVALVSTIMWIAVNASTTRMLERVEWIVEHDVHAREHGFEALARFHSDRSEFGRAGFWAERGYEHSRNPRLATLAAQHWEKAGQVDEARALLGRALERRPDDHRVRHELVRMVAETQDWNRVLLLSTQGTQRHPTQPAYWFFAAESLMQLDRRTEAIAAFEACLTMPGLPERARAHIERSLLSLRTALASE